MSWRRIRPGPVGCRAWGLSPPRAPWAVRVQGAARGDWAGAFCQQPAGSYFSQSGARKAGGLLSTHILWNCFKCDSVLLQLLPPDLHSPPSMLLRALREVPAVTEVFPSHAGGDTGDCAGPGVAEKTRARWWFPLAKQRLSPFRWRPSQERRTATFSAPEGSGGKGRSHPPSGQRTSAAPAAAFGLDGEVRGSTPGPLCFKSSNKVSSEVEQNSSSSPNSVPKGTIALTKISLLLLRSKTTGVNAMPELVLASPCMLLYNAMSIGDQERSYLQRATGSIPCLPSTETPQEAISSWLLGPEEGFSAVLTGMLSLKRRERYLSGSTPGLEPFAGYGPQRMETPRFSSSQGCI